MTTSHTTPPAIDEQKKRDFILQAAVHFFSKDIADEYFSLRKADHLAEEAQRRGYFNHTKK